MKVIDGLYYSKEHEWVRVDGNIAWIGITDYAQNALGEIVFVDVPETGSSYSASEVFGAVESVKAASDLYTPVSGTVLAVNDALADEPGLLNSDCYENWIIKTEMTNTAELSTLLNAADYQALLAG